MHDPCSSNENAPRRFPTTSFSYCTLKSIVVFVPKPCLQQATPYQWLNAGTVKTDQFLGVTGLWSFNIGSNTHRQLGQICLRPLGSLKFFFPTFSLFLLHKVRGASPTDYFPSLFWFTFYFFFHSGIFFLIKYCHI